MRKKYSADNFENIEWSTVYYIPLWTWIMFIFFTIIIIVYMGSHDFGEFTFNDVWVTGMLYTNKIDSKQNQIDINSNVTFSETILASGPVTFMSDINLGTSVSLKLGNNSRIVYTGEAPTINAIIVNADPVGTVTIDPTSTDTAGKLNFSGNFGEGSRVIVTFNKDYSTSPKVIIGNHPGISLFFVDSITTGNFILGGGFLPPHPGALQAGNLFYYVVETQ